MEHFRNPRQNLYFTFQMFADLCTNHVYAPMCFYHQAVQFVTDMNTIIPEI